MSDHYCCKKCHLRYDKCSCVSGFERKLLGQELKEEAEKLERHKKQEESAVYWLNVRAKAQKLFAQVTEECREKNKKGERTLGFGEIQDENVAKKLAEICKEEELKAVVRYHEGTESAYLHDDRASYYWLEISW